MLQNNEPSWLEIWERKGREAAGKPKYTIADLLSADGFDGAMAQTGPPAQQHIAHMIAESLGIGPGPAPNVATANGTAPKTTSVLEVGCGAGAVLSLLRDTGPAFTGVDYSAPHIEVARAALPEMEFHVSAASALPFPDAVFDAAFSYGVFLYFPDTAYASAVLREMLRVVRPAAPILIMDVPDAFKREACEEARRTAGAALNPPHCYYPKQFFEEFADSSGRHAKIMDQAVPGYVNSRFRYNVLF